MNETICPWSDSLGIKARQIRIKFVRGPFLCLFLFTGILAQANVSPLPPNVVTVGTLQHPALIESSGLTESERFPGVFWTHNDAGSVPFLFAIRENGEHLGAFEVKGAALIDWEAITYYQGYLYFADTGTNGLVRTHSAVHKVEEPDLSERWGPARVVQTWYVRFPGEREDCEGMFILDGFCYLLGKYPQNGSIAMYRFSLADSSASVLLEFVVRIPTTGVVSDAAISRDGARLALVSQRGVVVIFILGNPSTAGRAFRRSTDFQNTVMEGGTFVPNGLLVTSETIPDILLFTDPGLSGRPEFNTELVDQVGFLGESVAFSATAFGFPAPVFEWRFNGQLIPGQTGPVLNLTNIMLADAGIYELTASNATGVARSSARLTVIQRKANVRITEVMSSPAANTIDTADWWELTSFDSVPLDLSGWRFNDSLGGLADAFVLPAGIVIEPGGSIIFVEELTAGDFRDWWGAANLPGTRIIPYSGAALSFRATGDSLRLWDNLATDDNAVTEGVDFGQADTGVTFIYDPVSEQFGAKSQLGVHGAFRAAAGEDIGSPGRVRSAPVNEFRLEGQAAQNTIRIVFNSEAGSRYRLEFSESFELWNRSGESIEAPTNGLMYFEVHRDAMIRFYRVVRE